MQEAEAPSTQYRGNATFPTRPDRSKDVTRPVLNPDLPIAHTTRTPASARSANGRFGSFGRPYRQKERPDPDPQRSRQRLSRRLRQIEEDLPQAEDLVLGLSRRPHRTVRNTSTVTRRHRRACAGRFGDAPSF